MLSASLLIEEEPTGYGLDGRGSIPGKGKRFFCSPDRLWKPPSLLFSGFRR
jgi:hypothetical protein